MGIPAGLAKHVVAFHGAVAGNNILDRPGKNVADVGLAVGGRGAVVEGIGGRAAPQLHAFFKDALLLPESERVFFACREIEGCGNLFVHIVSPAILFWSNLYISEKRRFCKASLHGFFTFFNAFGFEVENILCYYYRDTICASVACFF
ncbi:hypothetical protein SDC9_193568 [bioreactor metagenome]|uniref:Uncharacterized protein n=1 Tax=bioreactor metagenome TaxID=1076179 RepID=A0A645I6G9_9ZZZZ